MDVPPMLISANFVQLLWTVLTFSMSRCNTATQFYVLRFFIGMYTNIRVILYSSLTGSLRSRREHFLPRNAVYHRVLVPQRRASQAIMYFPHKQWYR